eukprot:606136-Amphidinium_carterae.1
MDSCVALGFVRKECDNRTTGHKGHLREAAEAVGGSPTLEEWGGEFSFQWEGFCAKLSGATIKT